MRLMLWTGVYAYTRVLLLVCRALEKKKKVLFFSFFFFNDVN